MNAPEADPGTALPSGEADRASDRLESIAEAFVEAFHRGERPEVGEYARMHPELGKEIRELFPTLVLMEQAGQRDQRERGSSRSSSGSIRAREPLPSQMGEYRIVRELGRGGMGVVYEAVQESLGRRVALKILPSDSLSDARRLERFLREARAAARLQHPHIVPVFAVGEHAGTHFYAMQFIRGQGLDAVLRETRTKESREVSQGYFVKAARLSLQVAEALAYAHAEGILHRDIKPSNLLLDTHGDVWVTDFGLAKAEGSADLTHAGDILGTLRYMAPERLRGWSDLRSDVYSLGLTLYELLTLKPAFEAQERSSLVRKVLEESPLRPRRIDPRIPADLETIVLKASEKEPGHRYVSAAEMSADLRRFIAGEPIQARAIGSVERTWRWCRRNPVLAGLASSVAVLVFTVAVVASVSAVRLGESNREARQNLWSAYVEQARALRFSGRAGRRFDALDAIRKAAEIKLARENSETELRNEAVACMALEDLRVATEWKEAERKSISLAFDSRVERFVVNPLDGKPGLELRSVKDGAILRTIETGSSRHDVVLISPGDRYVAATWPISSGHGCQVFDLAENKKVLRVESLACAKAMAFSQDAASLATAQIDGTVLIHDLATGQESKRLATTFHVEHLAFRPDGAQIAIANHDNGQILVLDVKSGEQISMRELRNHAAWLAWSPLGDLLAAASMDNFTYVFDSRTWRIQSVLERHDGSVIYCAFNHRGDLLATSSWDGTTRLWDPWTGRVRLKVAGNLSSGFSDDDQRIGFWRTHAHWGVWEIAAGREMRVLGRDVAATNEYPCVDFSPDGRLMAFATDHGFGLWDLESSRRLAFVNTTRETTVRFDPGGQSLIVSGQNGLADWPLRKDGAHLKLGPPERLPEVARGGKATFSRDGRRLIVGDGLGSKAVVLDWSSKELIHALAHPGLQSVDLNPSGELALTGTWNGHGVKVWNVDDGNVIAELPITTSASAQFSPDGLHILTCDYREYCLWSTATLTPLSHLPLSDEGVPHPADISRDGKWIALSRHLGVAEIVDFSSGALIARLETPDLSHLGSMRFSPDSAHFAASPRNSIQLWDLQRVGESLRELNLGWKASVTSRVPDSKGAPPWVDVDPGLTSTQQSDWIAARWEKMRVWIAEQDVKILAAPRDALNYYRRGWLRKELSDWKGALEDLEKCLELDPTCYSAINDLAWLLVIGPEDLRRPERAASLARECLSYDPNPASTKNTLGAALYRLGKYDEAIRWLEDSARESILDDLALNELLLAMCHSKLGNPTIARKYYRQALESAGGQVTPNRDLNALRAEAEATLGLQQ